MANYLFSTESVTEGHPDKIADQISVMYLGRVVEFGSKQDILENPKHPYTQGLLKALPNQRHVGKLPVIDGSVPSINDRPKGCAFHPRCPKVMDICKTETPQLLPLKDLDRQVACHLY